MHYVEHPYALIVRKTVTLLSYNRLACFLVPSMPLHMYRTFRGSVATRIQAHVEQDVQ